MLTDIIISERAASKINYNNINAPFGLIGALRYDIEATYMSSRYKEAHLVQNSIVCRLLEDNFNVDAIVLDFGCGTGSDGIDILSKNKSAKYVGIDSSEYMLQMAVNKFEERHLINRSLFLNCDFRKLTAEHLFKQLETSNYNTNILCIISSLVLHHYNIKSRVNFYKLAFELLKKRGLFVLNDLFSNSIDTCDKIAIEHELTEIKEANNQLEKDGISKYDGSTLSVHHYLNENRPNHLIQNLNILENVGFGTVDILYRYGQLGVLVAYKGEL